MRGLLLVVAALLVAGCTDPAVRPTPPSNVTTPSIPTATTTTTAPVVTTPATPPEDPVSSARFDGASAFAFAREQVLRPDGTVRYRVPGTDGNEEGARLIADHLAEFNFTVSWHHFNATYGCAPTAMHNVVGERAGTSGRVVILGAHYDTRAVADKDPNPENRSKPIQGANDGASGVAVLLELARVLPATLNDTVRFVFFDGEDGGGDCADWILGSESYADNLTAEDLAATKAMVLVDMVGDPALVLPKEGLSRTGPGAKVQERLYEIGGGLGFADVFTNDTANGWSITDDHKPFLERNIPAVDLIHMVEAPRYFPSWHHTQADTLDTVSPGSLEIVGRTIEVWLRAGAPDA